MGAGDKRWWLHLGCHTLNSGTPHTDVTSSPEFFVCFVVSPLSKCNFPIQAAARDNPRGKCAFRAFLLLRFSMIQPRSWINYSTNDCLPGACHKLSVGTGQSFPDIPTSLLWNCSCCSISWKINNPTAKLAPCPLLGTCWKRRKIQYCN